MTKDTFLGESYKNDATWMNGLREFGDFEIICWELKHQQQYNQSHLRILEFKFAYFKIVLLIENS
jgi:hypothetical protein